MNIILVILLAVCGTLFRLVPHPANFTPLGAVMMFAAWRLPRGRGVAIVLGSMFLSDAMIGFYDWRLMVIVYGSLAAMGLFGGWIGKQVSWARVAIGSFAASLVFYLATNFAVWALSSWYAPNLGGLIHSYVLALPFFRNSLMGDLVFSFLLFGAYEWIRKRGTAPPLRERPLALASAAENSIPYNPYNVQDHNPDLARETDPRTPLLH